MESQVSADRAGRVIKFEFDVEKMLVTAEEGKHVVARTPAGVFLDEVLDITADPIVGIVALGVEAGFAAALMRHWLASANRCSVGESIFSEQLRVLPGLRELVARFGDLQPSDRISLRLFDALRHADLHAAAVAYFAAPVSPAGARAFADGLVVTTGDGKRLAEDRAALMPLIQDAKLRSEFAALPAPPSPQQPPATIGRITELLSPRGQFDFAKACLAARWSRGPLIAAMSLGLIAEAGDGDAAFAKLVAEVRRLGLFRQPLLADRLVNLGLSGFTLSTVDHVSELKKVGSEARNCLNNRHHGWPQRVAKGEVQLVVIRDEASGELVAILALDRDGTTIEEFKGKANGVVPPALRQAVTDALVSLSDGAFNLPAEDPNPALTDEQLDQLRAQIQRINLGEVQQ